MYTLAAFHANRCRVGILPIAEWVTEVGMLAPANHERHESNALDVVLIC